MQSGGSHTPPGDDEPSSRPLILLEPGRLHEARDQAEQAIIDAGLPIFQRDGRIVQVVGVHKREKGIERPAGAPQIVAVEVAHLLALLSSVADFAKPKRSRGPRKKGLDSESEEGEWALCDAPARLAEAILANPESQLPELVAFIEAPILTPGGALRDKPGHIPEYGLLLTAVPEDWSKHRPKTAPVNLQPRAVRAVDVLSSALKTFPFETDGDMAAAVAMIVTGLVRRILPAAPIFGVTAPTPGTGKSLLADVVSIICTGRPAAVMSIGDDLAELEKRLGAVLIAGDSFVNIDNLSVPMKSDLLCSIATQPEVLIRVLGVSKRAKITTRTLVVITGNNLTIRGDLTRRVVPVRLNARVEQPETRAFDNDPKDEALRLRARLIAAALEIVQCYIAAGRPDVEASPYGSFGDWDRMVRRPLVWGGLADPLGGADGLRGADPDREAHGAVLEAWLQCFGSSPVSAHDVVSSATNREITDRGELGPLVHAGLHEALGIAISSRSGTFSARSLGYWLRAHADRPEHGLVLRQVGVRSGIRLWAVESA